MTPHAPVRTIELRRRHSVAVLWAPLVLMSVLGGQAEAAPGHRGPVEPCGQAQARLRHEARDLGRQDQKDGNVIVIVPLVRGLNCR